MSTLALIFLSLFVLTSVSALVSLPLERLDWWLKAISGALAGLTVMVGIWAFIIGEEVSDIQKERIAILEKAKTEAELRLEELKQAQVRMKLPRWALVNPLGEFLKGKPKGSVEVVFAPEDDEAFKTAMGIEAELSVSGWRITRNARPYSAEDILPQFSTPEMEKNVFNMPLFSRVGGLSDLTVVMSPADMSKGFPNEGTAAHALYFGLISCGFEPLPNIDNRLPAGAVRVVVGPKQ